MDASPQAEGAAPFVFIEANARLQVEHTVTEAVTGVDLVQTQIRLAQGATLLELGLDRKAVAAPRGYAIQARVNMETIGPDGSVRPGGGKPTVYEAPNGPGVRTDGFGYSGYQTSSAFDSLLAKVVAHASDFPAAIARASRALSEFRLEGVATNIAFLRDILAHPDFAAGNIHTGWVDEHIAELASGRADRRQRFVEPLAPAGGGFAGARVDRRDPLALFAHDDRIKADATAAEPKPEMSLSGPDGSVGIASPIQGTLAAIFVSPGETVRQRQPVAIVEAMKMEHVITAPHSGVVRAVTMAVGDVVREGFPLVFVQEAEVEGEAIAANEALDPDHIRDDLRESFERHAR